MKSYTLVRESRDGRQSPDETVHCLSNGTDETVCGEYKRDEVRTVRTLAAFTGDSPFCPDCQSRFDSVL